MTKKSWYETRACGRCGGSGRYSFNYMHGDMCYGCSGSGYKYTKRGAMARALYNKLRTVKYEDLVPGHVVYMTGFCGGWHTITEIDETGFTVKNGTRIGSGQREYMVKISKKQHGENMAKALTYQYNLTKAGKPRKKPLSDEEITKLIEADIERMTE